MIESVEPCWLRIVPPISTTPSGMVVVAFEFGGADGNHLHRAKATIAADGTVHRVDLNARWTDDLAALVAERAAVLRMLAAALADIAAPAPRGAWSLLKRPASAALEELLAHLAAGGQLLEPVPDRPLSPTQQSFAAEVAVAKAIFGGTTDAVRHVALRTSRAESSVWRRLRRLRQKAPATLRAYDALSDEVAHRRILWTIAAAGREVHMVDRPVPGIAAFAQMLWLYAAQGDSVELAEAFP